MRARIANKAAAGLFICLGIALAALTGGCGLFRTAVHLPGNTVRAVTPGNSDKPPPDPVELQQNVFRLSDDFLTRLALGADRLRRDQNIVDPADALRWKIALCTEVTSIASGPNPLVDLMDLTVFVTETRMSLEEYWQPKVFGESAQTMIESCRASEQETWRVTGNVLNPEQLAELRKAIDKWHAQNPFPDNVLAARAIGFTEDVRSGNKPGGFGNMFDFGMLDPFGGLDPAVREIAKTRLFAERALYVTQKMPTLLRWQTELLTLTTITLPEVRQLVTNTTQIAASTEQFAALAEKLPTVISSEREEIMKALEAQEKSLTPLISEVNQTLATGAGMSSSLNTTLTTFDGLMKRFGVGETNSSPTPPDTNSQPFRIQDYAQTAAQFESTAKQVTALLVTLDQTLGSTNLLRLSEQAGPVVQQAETGGKSVVQYAFWKAVEFVGVVLLAALIYRFVAGRFFPGARKNST